VGVFCEGPDREACFQRIAAALILIRQHDPSTFTRIRTRFSGILVFGNERYRLAYWKHSGRLCVITVRYILSPESSPEDLALTLAHEAMHARLFDLGDEYIEGRRARIEVICAMAELALARQLPESRALVEQAEHRIQDFASTSETHWSSATARTEEFRYLREMGAPRWMLSIVDRLNRLVTKRAA